MKQFVARDVPDEAISPQTAANLTDRVTAALANTGLKSLRNIAVDASAGVVTLRGTVRSYYMKQLAQATARAVRGVHRVQNDLDVVWREPVRPVR